VIRGKTFGKLFLYAVVLTCVVVALNGCMSALSSTYVSAYARDADDFVGGDGITGLEIGFRPLAGLEPPRRVIVDSMPHPMAAYTDPPPPAWSIASVTGWGFQSPVYRYESKLGPDGTLPATPQPPWWRDEERVKGILKWIGAGLALVAVAAWREIKAFLTGWKETDPTSHHK